MITPQQFRNPQVKPKWQLPVGVMESVVAYNCRKYGMPRPVLAMPMWEGAGNRALDYSGHGNHGVITGADWVADGLDFESSNTDYVNCGNGNSIGITEDLTIISKIKLESQPPKAYQIVAKDKNTGGRAYAFDYDYDAGGNRFRLYINGGGGNNEINGGSLSTGINYTIAGVYSTAGTLDLYKDGVSAATQVTGADLSIPTATANLLIGAREYAANENYIDGVIAYVYIYNRALTAAQIKFLYDNPYFMYQIPEELYGYVSAVVGEANPYWYYQMLKRRN